MRKCINAAISHGHERVEQADVLAAERQFSEDMLNDLHYEMRDVFPQYPNIVLKFLHQSDLLSRDDITLILMEANVPDDHIGKVLDLLLWFSFLGITRIGASRFSYEVMYNLEKLKGYAQSTESSALVYTLHPAFRTSLEIH